MPRGMGRREIILNKEILFSGLVKQDSIKADPYTLGSIIEFEGRVGKKTEGMGIQKSLIKRSG